MPQSPHRLRNDLKCVEWDVKPCSINQSIFPGPGNNLAQLTSLITLGSLHPGDPCNFNQPLLIDTVLAVPLEPFHA